jgi:hypothetical protein
MTFPEFGCIRDAFGAAAYARLANSAETRRIPACIME